VRIVYGLSRWLYTVCKTPSLFGHSRQSSTDRAQNWPTILLGRVALVAQRPLVIKLSSGRSVRPYARLCVGQRTPIYQESVQCIVEKGGSDPDAVWHHRSDGSIDKACSALWRSVHWKGYFWGRIRGAPL